MKLDRRAGWALVVSNDTAKVLEFRNAKPEGSVTFELPWRGARWLDYDVATECYYDMSDDGSQWYDVIHVVAAAERMEDLPPIETVPLPDASEIPNGVGPSLASMMEALRYGADDPEVFNENLSYARNAVSRVASIYAKWLEVGDVAAAQQDVVDEILREIGGFREKLMAALGAAATSMHDTFGVNSIEVVDGDQTTTLWQAEDGGGIEPPAEEPVMVGKNITQEAGWALAIVKDDARTVEFRAQDGVVRFRNRNGGWPAFQYHEGTDAFYIENPRDGSLLAAIHVVKTAEMAQDLPSVESVGIPGEDEISRVAASLQDRHGHDDKIIDRLTSTVAGIYSHWSSQGVVEAAPIDFSDVAVEELVEAETPHLEAPIEPAAQPDWQAMLMDALQGPAVGHGPEVAESTGNAGDDQVAQPVEAEAFFEVSYFQVGMPDLTKERFLDLTAAEDRVLEVMDGGGFKLCTGTVVDIVNEYGESFFSAPVA